MTATIHPTIRPIPVWLRYMGAVLLGMVLLLGALLAGGHSDLIPRGGGYEIPPFAIDVP